jgi:hypothetical protein
VVFGPALASAAAKPVPRWHDLSGTLRRVQENTRRIAAIRAADRAEAALGAAITSRAAPMLVVPLRGRDRWKVAKTAVFTWIVDTVRRVRPGSPGRFDANKAAYLTERILELDLFRGFRPEKLGMWNPVLVQLEREAAKRRWLAGSSRGDRFSAGPKLDEALAIARERLSDPELADPRDGAPGEESAAAGALGDGRLRGREANWCRPADHGPSGCAVLPRHA